MADLTGMNVGVIQNPTFAGRDIITYEFRQVYGDKTPLQVLRDHAAPGAFHDSHERYDPPKCEPTTRVAILNDLKQQILIATVSCMVWMYGVAGAGKSAIAQSLAEVCSEAGTLIGSFFFLRSSRLRNNAKRLGASLVYQLAQSIPSTLPHIAACLSSNPAIFDTALENQLRKLFVEPLLRVHEETPELNIQPKLIILDGLDECDGPEEGNRQGTQRYILAVLGKVLQETPVPIVVFVSSRAEPHIASAVAQSNVPRFPTTSVDLNTKYDADHDIHLYLEAKFDQIKRTHPTRFHIPEDWPQPKDLNLIVEKSFGQFTFASTVIRHVESARHDPRERLAEALKEKIDWNLLFMVPDTLTPLLLSSVPGIPWGISIIIYLCYLNGWLITQANFKFM